MVCDRRKIRDHLKKRISCLRYVVKLRYTIFKITFLLVVLKDHAFKNLKHIFSTDSVLAQFDEFRPVAITCGISRAGIRKIDFFH